MKTKMQNCTTIKHNSFVLSERELLNTDCIHIGNSVKLTGNNYIIM